MAEPALLEARGLSKRYGASERRGGAARATMIHALADFDLAVVPGEIVGLLGPNGAGKTTALRLMGALLTPTAGETLVEGKSTRDDPVACKRSIGFLSATTGLYGRLTVRECLDFFAALCALDAPVRAARIEALAGELSFAALLDQRCDRLSTGQRQRVSIARAILHRPRVLLFDEPTAGLDLFAARVVHDMARRARAEGAAIVWSTHDLTEAELLCDRMVLLFGGRVRGAGTAAELRARAGVATLAEVFFQQGGGE
jgi:sodium transport system ATP-binding protein